MDSHACPKGHPSTEPDFCSECGAKIQAATQAAVPDAAPKPPETCPDCGIARAPDSGSFCEVCGHNFATGARGEIAITQPAVESPPVGWLAVITIDPSLREPDSPDPPAGVGPITIALDKPANLIGRRSDSRAIFPEIALNYDEAVSHRHALLQRRDDGALVLRDIGASNGTKLNGQDLEPLVDKPLRDGDEITLGHWTRITIKAVT